MTNIFGTDGIRDRAGSGLLSPDALLLLGKAIARWAVNKYSSPRILIAHDTRISCAWVKAALKSGMLTFPLELIDGGILPTPTAYHLIKYLQYDAALIISASHNPYYDNGIKIFDTHTGKISSADEMTITDFFYTSKNAYTSTNEQPLSYGTESSLQQTNEQAITHLAHYFPQNFLKNKKIILDTANGATSFIAPQLFTLLGAQIITLHNRPNGLNINAHCGALHIASLQKAVQEHHADIGFAFDGDGDRVIAVNKGGVIKNGDDLLAILLTHPAYVSQSTIVGTVMTNYGFEQYLTHHNKRLLRTPVGDKYVSEALESHNLLLGGEQSGHIILGDMLNSGDGILTALRILEALIITNNWQMDTFIPTPQTLINCSIAHKKDLTSGKCAELIAAAQEILRHTGRILVRYSGTEPLLRVMVEAEQIHQAQELAHLLSQQLMHELNKS